jgi:hypothetical protein
MSFNDKKVDVSIAFYGKPYQAIVTIKSLMKYSGAHIDQIYFSRERKQPHNDYIGIFKVIDYFRNDPDVRLIVQYPYHHLGLGVMDIERAKVDTRWRHSIMYQYALETTDKKYLCIMHNDMLYHKDMIGDMLKEFDTGPPSLAGVGSIGQCWSCPAGPAWGNRCNSYKYQEYVPSLDEALELTAAYATPRQKLQKSVIEQGRVHMLPECRLNEYCALIDVDKYRLETVPNGNIGCYGGNWGGVDTATVWSHDMYRKGYVFKHLCLEDYTRHAPFDGTGSGTQANTSRDIYENAERNAKAYIEQNFGQIRQTPYVGLANIFDAMKRNAWLGVIHTYGFVKRIFGK